jgi:hypothetical protein
MLTDYQLQLLEKPFDLNEHAFLQSNVYIKKSAIRHRLHLVDPGWELSAPEVVATMNDVITLRAGLTICGVTRFAVGTGAITRYDKDGVERSPAAITRETVKAIKYADSDLLPRCASKFGVGNYLREMTKAERDSVNNMTGLKSFLDKLNAPQHWALNGGGKRINEKMISLKLKWDYVAEHAEAGRRLSRLSDTTLTELQFAARLDELAAQIAADQAKTGVSDATDPKGS